HHPCNPRRNAYTTCCLSVCPLRVGGYWMCTIVSRSAPPKRYAPLAIATATTSGGLARQELRHPGGFYGGRTRLPQDRERPGDQDAPQVSVASLGDGVQSLLAAGRFLARDDADPGCKVATRLED